MSTLNNLPNIPHSIPDDPGVIVFMPGASDAIGTMNIMKKNFYNNSYKHVGPHTDSYA